jgi:hypothetical protein
VVYCPRAGVKYNLIGSRCRRCRRCKINGLVMQEMQEMQIVTPEAGTFRVHGYEALPPLAASHYFFS